MVMLYVSCVIRGIKKFSDVPITLKEDVRRILISEGLEHLTLD
jgi:hypothetical protein